MERRTRRTPVSQKKVIKALPTKKYQWSIREKKALVEALKKHGFGDTELLAKDIKTRTKNEVEHFMGAWSRRVARQVENSDVNVTKLFYPTMQRKPVNPDIFPPIAQWKKVISCVMQGKAKKDDYSTVLAEVFKKFSEEAPDCDDPKLCNFKEIYKFYSDALQGHFPPRLSNVNSFAAIYMIQDMINFITENNLEEEFKFMKNFFGPAKFVPVFKKDKDKGVNESKLKDDMFKNDIEEEVNESKPKDNRMCPPVFQILIIDENDENSDCSDTVQETVVKDEPEGTMSQNATDPPLNMDNVSAASNSEMVDNDASATSNSEMMDNDASATSNSETVDNDASATSNSEMVDNDASATSNSKTVGNDASDTCNSATVDCKSEAQDEPAMNSDSQMMMPLSIFAGISNHLKIRNDLNPLMTPAYLHHCEHHLIANYIANN